MDERPWAFPASDVGRLAGAVERFLFTVVRQRGTNPREAGSLLLPAQTVALCATVDCGPLRLGALAEHIHATPATATRTADSLEALGLLERIDDPDDRRATLIASTERGRQAVVERRRRLVQLLEEALAAAQHDQLEHFSVLFEELDSLVDPVHHRDAMA